MLLVRGARGVLSGLLLALAAGGCGDSTSSPPQVAADGGGGGSDTGPITPGQEGGVVNVPTLTVSAQQNALALDACRTTPAAQSLPAGNYTIALAASSLSKGQIASDTPTPSVDPYVIVHLPLAAGAQGEDHRFFMLNGIGASAPITLPAAGIVQAMFVDSDTAANNGNATVTINPGGYQLIVDAAANVLAWSTGCQGTPATLDVKSGDHSLKLISSTLSSGQGAKDDFVLLRLPSEVPEDSHRYVMLSGVGASVGFNVASQDGGTLRAFFLEATRSGSGQAIVQLTK